MIRLGAMALLLTGCQLIIGEIELPQVVDPDADPADLGVVDAAPDASLDATPVDATLDARPPVDAALPLDAGWPDAAPDASPDAAPPPTVDLAALHGGWHVYGVQGRGRDLSVFSTVLRVGEGGRATVTAFGSAEPLSAVPTIFEAHPGGRGRLAVNLFPVAGLTVAAFDAQAGVAIFVNDIERMSTQPIFALAVRRTEEAEWPQAALYAQLTAQPEPGGGEVGILTRQMDPVYSQSLRFQFGDDADLGPRGLSVEAGTAGRLRFAVTGELEAHLMTPTADSGGAGLLLSSGEPRGLAVAWATSPGTVPAEVPVFCGGVRLDENNAFTVERALATLSPGAMLRFADGRDLELVPVDGLLEVRGEANLFHHSGGSAALDASGRALLLIDAALGARAGRWALGLCVAVGG